MESKSALWISLLAISIAFATFFHSFLVTEFGVLIGNNDYDIHINEHLNIQNTQGTLTLKPTLIVRNDGTIPLRVNKVRALLQLGSESHIFKSTFVNNISPQSVWSGYINLSEDLADGEMRHRDELHMDITNYLIDEYKKNKDKDIPIFLSPEFISRIEEVYASNASWMKHDDNYHLLLMIWLNGDEGPASERLLFKFEFNSFQKKIISEYQLNAAATPRADLIPANLSITFNARSKMEIILDAEKVDRTYLKYQELAKE
jgi:hypothetical protein